MPRNVAFNHYITSNGAVQLANLLLKFNAHTGQVRSTGPSRIGIANLTKHTDLLRFREFIDNISISNINISHSVF